MTKWLQTLAGVVFAFTVAGCTAEPPTAAPTESQIQVPTTPLIPIPTAKPPTAGPTEPEIRAQTTAPNPIPTAVPTCPEPTEGIQLFTNERCGYCLLAPAGYVWDETGLGDACIVTDDSVFFCIEVSDAAGRTTDQLADERLSQLQFDPGVEL